MKCPVGQLLPGGEACGKAGIILIALMFAPGREFFIEKQYCLGAMRMDILLVQLSGNRLASRTEKESYQGHAFFSPLTLNPLHL